MTSRLTDEQRAMRDLVKELADEKVAPRAAEIDQSMEFPWDMVELLARHDVLALPFPAKYGGLGGDLLTICACVEQLSRVCATTGLILAVQELGSTPLLRAALLARMARERRWFSGRRVVLTISVSILARGSFKPRSIISSTKNSR